MEALASQGAFAPPALRSLEAAMEYGVGLRQGRVFVDLWDIERGARTAVDLGRIGWIRSLAFSPAGDELAIAWDAGPGRQRR